MRCESAGPGLRGVIADESTFRSRPKGPLRAFRGVGHVIKIGGCLALP